MHERKPQWTVGRLSRREQIHFHWAEPLTYQLHHLGVKSPFPGPQPLPRQDVCSSILVLGDIHRSERWQFSPWITGGSGAPVCTEGATSDPPDGSNTRPLTYCLIVLGHGDRWDLEATLSFCTCRYEKLDDGWGRPLGAALLDLERHISPAHQYWCITTRFGGQYRSFKGWRNVRGGTVRASTVYSMTCTTRCGSQEEMVNPGVEAERSLALPAFLWPVNIKFGHSRSQHINLMCMWMQWRALCNFTRLNAEHV